jgi:hypothetical protein
MSVKCDFCQTDISHLEDFEYLCSCGKKSCSVNCHQFIRTNLVDGNCIGYGNVCYAEILKHGNKGRITYWYKDSYGFSGDAIIIDPDYQPMLEELEELREKVAQLSKEVISLQTQIDCAPGGIEY